MFSWCIKKLNDYLECMFKSYDRKHPSQNGFDFVETWRLYPLILFCVLYVIDGVMNSDSGHELRCERLHVRQIVMFARKFV